MGNILSRFKSLESTKETLARIHSEIEEIEDYKWITLRNQNHIIGFYIFGLAIVYAIVILTLYFYYMQRLKNKGFLACILYVTTFPILAYFLRSFLKSYYQHKLAVQEDRLHELKRNKRKILDEIMEKETYKVAKELIEKYDPLMLKEKASPDQLDLSMRLNQSMNIPNMSSALRRRMTPLINPMNQSAMASLVPLTDKKTILPPTGTPKPLRSSQLAIQATKLSNTNLRSQQPNQSINRPIPPTFNPALMPSRRPNLVRPICSQDRSIVEKIVDYLVSDGPNNRYGLICKFCYSHNGMALKEEFDYLNFRCCFCNNLNLARKQKPLAPSLVSYENAKENVANESVTTSNLNESLKKFKIDDDLTETLLSKNNQLQIEEIENKLNETKLNEESKSTEKTSEDDEMQVDDMESNKTTLSEIDMKNVREEEGEIKERLSKQLDDIKLT